MRPSGNQKRITRETNRQEKDLPNISVVAGLFSYLDRLRIALPQKTVKNIQRRFGERYFVACRMLQTPLFIGI